MKNQELETAAAEIAGSVSDYLRSVAEHLCVISQMSGINISDLLINLALLARAAERKKESENAAASEKAI
ncbi:hypothetical protein [Campylobacter gracilis]|uniref:Uncharacterized protein n=1 Tax=Campylobacter gracilis RM3268 TaxID=553220 RepID=C8PFH8_9BACT|nr:hypothetical protein [Campylobacter gracilis]AKT91706.1 hypothetical protein CGRAC_0237 [Campylobacter gracilis]EEV18444.1 hypothetical protein CAMGR0001_2136 [Campylobacter gracilis RM3268]UEB46083.1 hypothetical protein LK410_03015 [Campylobacter gracilis]SUW77841.1 Uncharacterised protein [Campylobacter gracilis]